jgi:hypothetical protein
MTKQELQEQFVALLERVRDEGPGARAVARIVARELTLFIFDEAGAFAPDAVTEAADLMQALVDAVENEHRGGDWVAVGDAAAQAVNKLEGDTQ